MMMMIMMTIMITMIMMTIMITMIMMTMIITMIREVIKKKCEKAVRLTAWGGVRFLTVFFWMTSLMIMMQ